MEKKYIYKKGDVVVTSLYGPKNLIYLKSQNDLPLIMFLEKHIDGTSVKCTCNDLQNCCYNIDESFFKLLDNLSTPEFPIKIYKSDLGDVDRSRNNIVFNKMGTELCFETELQTIMNNLIDINEAKFAIKYNFSKKSLVELFETLKPIGKWHIDLFIDKLFNLMKESKNSFIYKYITEINDDLINEKNMKELYKYITDTTRQYALPRAEHKVRYDDKVQDLNSILSSVKSIREHKQMFEILKRIHFDTFNYLEMIINIFSNKDKKKPSFVLCYLDNRNIQKLLQNGFSLIPSYNLLQCSLEIVYKYKTIVEINHKTPILDYKCLKINDLLLLSNDISEHIARFAALAPKPIAASEVKVEELFVLDIPKSSEIIPLPKIIHLIWFGSAPDYAQEHINKWKKDNPNFDIWVWTSDLFIRDIEKLKSCTVHNVNEIQNLLQLIQPWLEQDDNTWEHIQFAAASDITRSFVIYNYGGYYFDFNTIPGKIPDWNFPNGYFFSYMNHHDYAIRLGNLQFIMPGIQGAYTNHPLFKNICELHKIIAQFKIYNILKDKSSTIKYTCILYFTGLVHSFTIQILMDNYKLKYLTFETILDSLLDNVHNELEFDSISTTIKFQNTLGKKHVSMDLCPIMDNILEHIKPQINESIYESIYKLIKR